MSRRNLYQRARLMSSVAFATDQRASGPDFPTLTERRFPRSTDLRGMSRQAQGLGSGSGLVPLGEVHIRSRPRPVACGIN